MQKPSGWWRRELEDLAAQRHGDPGRALSRVEGLRREAPDDAEAVGLLLWINGLFLHELVQLEEAEEEFERAISWAVDHGLADVEARARANLAILLTDLGRTGEADHQMAVADRAAPASARGLVTYLRALSLQRQGHHHAAVATYEQALPLLRAVGDLVTIEVLRLNLGVALIYLDDLDGARRELSVAETAADRLGLTILAAMAAHNLGFLESRRGLLADALASLDRAEARYRELTGRPRQLPVLHSDRAEVLLQAGLATDARLSAATAIEELDADGNVADLTEARLLLARTCLATGDYDEAKRVALQAARGFRATRRAPWVTQVAYVARQVDYYRGATEGRPAPVVSRRFEHLAGELMRHGWPVEGRDALVFAALAALDAGDTDRAGVVLGRVTRLRSGGAVQHRARFHLARAALLQQTGHRRPAAALIGRGVRDALDVLAVTGSTEARFEALRFAGELAALGTELALERGWPVGVLRAVERQRSVASTVTPAGVSSGPDLGEALDGLRAEPSEPTADAERTIRERSLRSRATADGRGRRVSWRALRMSSASGNLVYFVDAGDAVRAVVVRGRVTRLITLAPKADVVQQADFLQFAVQRLVALGATDERASAAVNREARRVDEMLIEPLRLESGPLVIVPCPAVKEILWALLPSLADHDFSLAGSGLDWSDAVARPPRPSQPRTVLVSGPRLEASDEEIHGIAALYPDATALTGREATVHAVLEAFANADLVHVASHGVFRAESPMFSRLELSDGPLTIYDLERLDQLPALVVLSACEAAASRLYPSGGALGTASALTALGARSVVAPVQPVADSATYLHMVAFHEHLSGGASPARALRLAMAGARAESSTDRLAVAAMFVTIGAG